MARPPFILAALAAALAASAPAADGGDATAFFESRIRPLLAEHCQECHGDKKQKGGLRLDSREGWMRGGDSGPPIVAGKPDASLLIKAVSYTDRDLKMPPKKKLSAQQAEHLRQWIAAGASDPRDAPARSSAGKQHALTVAEGRNFWSFKPVKNPPEPAIKDQAWPRNEIDRFVFAKLEAAEFHPSPDAGIETLVRRLSFDLTGLPPTDQTLARFRECAPGNRESELTSYIDQLLASPQFAERWASHWLDIVRFAESSGGGRTLPFKDAWRYRDYVIESFRNDVPLDRFLTEQLAGDLLPHTTAAERRRHLAATSFLALGPTNYEEQDKQLLRMDIVDEQLDTVGKSFLGMTIGCARCHDHKFDPIPTRDYYALAGIFRSTKTLENYTDNVAHWIDVPLPLDGEEELRVKQAEIEARSMEDEIARLKDQLRGSGGLITTRKKIIAASGLEGIVVDDAEAMKVGEWAVSNRFRPFIGKGYSHDENEGKGEKTISFTPKIPKTGKYEVRIAFNAGPTRTEKAAVTVFHADGEELLHVKQQTGKLEGIEFASIGVFRFEDSGQGYVLVSNAGSQGYVTVDAVQFIPQEPAEPAAAPKSSTADSSMKKKLSEMEKRLKEHEKTRPKRPEVMSVADDEQPEDSPVHIRGSIRNLGPVVPRGFLQVAMTSGSPPIPKDQSGRLQFAQWLASPSNPLTARVYVNRAWHWLVGAGIVRTTENFGTTGELPSHPELLDHLASRFMSEGWSTRKLVRLIVTSRTYQMSSETPAAAPKSGFQTPSSTDPDNRLLWRMNRKRLDAECIRDAMLVAAGSLDDKIGGPNLSAGTADSNSTATQNLEYNYQFTDTRRSLYTPAFRNTRHPLFEVFDFADINQPLAQRTTSTVAPQALFMRNSDFVIQQARAAAAQIAGDVSPGASAQVRDRIRRAFRLSLGRDPSDREAAASLEFIEASQSGNNTAEDQRDIWARLIQALWATPEFRFLH